MTILEITPEGVVEIQVGVSNACNASFSFLVFSFLLRYWSVSYVLIVGAEHLRHFGDSGGMSLSSLQHVPKRNILESSISSISLSHIPSCLTYPYSQLRYLLINTPQTSQQTSYQKNPIINPPKGRPYNLSPYSHQRDRDSQQLR